MTLRNMPFENIVGKGENAGMFLPKTNFNFSVTFILLSAKAFNFDQSKILSIGTDLTPLPHSVAF